MTITDSIPTNVVNLNSHHNQKKKPHRPTMVVNVNFLDNSLNIRSISPAFFMSLMLHARLSYFIFERYPTHCCDSNDLLCLICDFTSQPRAMVMSRWSVNLKAIWLGKLGLLNSILCNIFVYESVEGDR